MMASTRDDGAGVEEIARDDEAPGASSPLVTRGSGRKKWHQFAAVGKKNFILIKKHWMGSTASQLLAPVVVVLILRMMQGIGNSSLSRPDPRPERQAIAKVQTCRHSGASTCETLLYAPGGVPWVEEVMEALREENGLARDEVKPVSGLPSLESGSHGAAEAPEWCMDGPETPLPCPTASANASIGIPVTLPDAACSAALLAQGHLLMQPCALMRDNATITDFMLAHPGRAQNVVIFPAAYLGLSADFARTYPFGYDLYYNHSVAQFPFRGNDHVLEVKRALDQAILTFSRRDDSETNGAGGNQRESEARASPGAEVEVSWSAFPRPEPRLKGFSAVAVGGGYWFYLPPMIIFFTTLIDIVREKENGSRLMMSVMGLPSCINWGVWFIQGSIFAQLSAVILILSGLACNFDLFWNANFFVLFLLFSFFGVAMVSASQLLATMMTTVKGAQTVGYAIILVGFVFQAILGSGYGSLIYLLQSTTLPAWVVPIRCLLQLYPPYLMSMMYYMVTKKSASIVNVQEATVERGDGFSFGDLFVTPDVSGSRFFGSMDVRVPKPITCLLMLGLDTILFALVALYLDHVVPNGNGIVHHPFFFLRRSYWFSKKSRKFPPHKRLQDHHKSFAEVVEELRDFKTKDVVDEAIKVNEKMYHFMEDDSAILVNMLTKTYAGSCCGCLRSKRPPAVDRLSLHLEKNAIFCLLGHNGAGKSTTMNILTGIIAPSSGFVSICGHDIKENLHDVQTMIGVSPQFDCLWDELTAMDHLRIYAAVKGISPDRIDEEARYCLTYVDLIDMADSATGTYSGGMKRRLSLAIALIGDPKAIFLDEPTTGMDPVHKQEAWTMIQKMKRDRIVVLTTHSMEEADCLGDRIGIMGSGRLQCVGTSLSLKNAYGSGYRLRLFAPEREWSVKISAEILAQIPESKLLRSNAGSMTFTIPFKSVDNLPSVMNLFEHQYASQILEWSISHTTLEEVFLLVTTSCGFAANFEEQEEAAIDQVEGDAGSKHLEAPASEEESQNLGGKNESELFGLPEHAFEIEMPQKPGQSSERSRRWCHPRCGALYGLVAKHSVLQRRQTFQLMCQVGTPLLIMLTLTFLGALVRIESEKMSVDGSTRVLIKSLPYSLSTGAGLPFGSPLGGATNTSDGKYCYQRFSYVDETGGTDLGGLTEQGKGASSDGLLSHIPQHACALDYGRGERVLAPFFQQNLSEADMTASLYDDLMTLNAYEMSELGEEPQPSYLLSDGAVTFEKLDLGQRAAIGYSFSVNDNFLVAYHRPNGITRARMAMEGAHSFQSTGFSVLGNQGRAFVMEMIDRAFMRALIKSHDRYLEILSALPEYVKPLVGVGSVLYNMPKYEESRLTNIVQIFGSFLYPIALVLQLPLYMYVTVMEKEKNLRQCQLNSGMSLGLYHMSSFIFNLLMYACIVIFMVVIGHLVDLTFFSRTDPTLLFLFFFGWGLSMVAFSIFLSSFINSSRVATVIGYSVVLFGTGLGIMLSQGVYGDNPTRPEMPRMPSALNLIPQFAMIRSVYLMNWSCTMKDACVSGVGSNGSAEVTTCIGFMFLDFFLYSVIGFYFDKVLPKPNEASSHWLFFLPEQWRLCGTGARRTRKISPIQSMVEILSQSEFSDKRAQDGTTTTVAGPEGAKAVDADVLEEELLAARTAPSEGEVVIQNLRKNFGDKIAVKDLGLVINKSECFGLLGENGAGKTTLINMLSCSLAPTQGTAYLAGYDVRNQSDSIQKLLGICPQFDVLWDDLTIREHMTLFLRLKTGGASTDRLAAVLNEVGLVPFQDKRVSDLSGGMKRRLSVAIALAGDSRVILLDEVTTGLDPYSRRQLWNILKRCQKTRAMILTTHAMDEAELLCTRLGIMVQGRLQCLGTSASLKEKFGRGYILLLNFPEDRKTSVARFLCDRFGLKPPQAAGADKGSGRGGGGGGGAEVVKDFPGQLMVRIPVDRTTSGDGDGGEGSSEPSIASAYKMSSIFSVMVTEGSDHGITDWAVSQVGLNEVFQSVLEEAKRAAKAPAVLPGEEIP